MILEKANLYIAWDWEWTEGASINGGSRNTVQFVCVVILVQFCKFLKKIIESYIQKVIY